MASLARRDLKLTSRLLRRLWQTSSRSLSSTHVDERPPVEIREFRRGPEIDEFVKRGFGSRSFPEGRLVPVSDNGEEEKRACSSPCSEASIPSPSSQLGPEQFLSRRKRLPHLDLWRRGFSTTSNAGVAEEDAPKASVSWVETVVPKQVRPYVYLARLDKPIGTWLLAWPCFW